VQKIICTVLGVWVSKQKHWEPLEKGKWSNKRVRIEDELEAELEGIGMGCWKARGLQDISFSLLGLKDSMEDQNELLREQNGYLKRIAMQLDAGLGPEEGEVPVDNSTIRE